MGVEYKVLKLGLYWFVVISIEDINDLYLLEFMKGNTFGLLEVFSISSSLKNYKDRIDEQNWRIPMNEIIQKSNYLKNEKEIEISDDKIPSRLFSKIIKFIQEKSKTI